MISINKEFLGKFDGKNIEKYILKNDEFEVHIINLGATITKILTKDKNGEFKNVVLGYDFFEKYIENASYAGSIIGPTSGRIEDGKYTIEGIDLVLGINNGTNANHGGIEGLNMQVFSTKVVEFNEYKGIEMTYFWDHLKGNHYGNMEFNIRYFINEKSELKVELFASSDRTSYINLTNHSYFNLSGDLNINGDEQILKVNADRYCPVKNNMIPSGEKKEVKNSCFDFLNGRKIKEAIAQGDEQFGITRAIDHAFVINKSDSKYAGSLYSEYSGINMDIYTTQNVLVVYTGNYLDDVITFDGINKNTRFLGAALEAQNYQNGINIEEFDSKLTTPKNPYYEEIIYKFSLGGN